MYPVVPNPPLPVESGKDVLVTLSPLTFTSVIVISKELLLINIFVKVGASVVVVVVGPSVVVVEVDVLVVVVVGPSVVVVDVEVLVVVGANVVVVVVV
jgi:hypothetical protein